MAKIIEEFKAFISRGNVVDLTVGVIIGGAFGKISNSIINDLVMPPLGYLVAGINFTKLKWVIGKGEDAAIINYGNFIQTLVEFLIISFVIFLAVKAINSLRAKIEKEQAEAAEAAPAPEPSAQEKLLAEIRDLLKSRN